MGTSRAARRGWAVPARLTAPALAVALVAPQTGLPGGPPPAAADTAAGPACPGRRQGAGWESSSTAIDPRNDYHAVTGNGYLAARVPANGAGYSTGRGRSGWPLYTRRYDGSFVSGLYARDPRVAGGREVIAALPAWTSLTVGAGRDSFTAQTPPARISRYRQTLYLGCGLIRTSLTWTARDGRRTDLLYEVLTDRADPHVAAVRLRMTPHWTGEATATDLIDGRAARRLAPAAGGSAPAGHRAMVVGFRTQGTAVRGAVASVLSTESGLAAAADRPATRHRGLTNRQAVVFPVRRGAAYTLTKYVGIDTALTARAPVAAALSAARRAADHGWNALSAANAGAWAKLWRSGTRVRGRPRLQRWIRSSEYGLFTSVRAGLPNSIAPTGLTSDDYAGLVFWDAETWMFPSLLPYHPALARSIVDYRYRTRAAARANARRLGYRGLFYPWESGSTGDLYRECISWQPPHCLTQIHLQSDIALAVWQYYRATGDTAWLRERGWPVLRGIARFWTGRVFRNADGSYSIRHVTGPDEYHNGVTDDVFTNAGAATALRHAVAAARLLGRTAPAAWTRIADRLRIPYRSAGHHFEQYRGYRGGLIKQADAVLLVYPLQWPMSRRQALSTVEYYAPRTDRDGPAMTDSVESVAAAAAHAPGGTVYTHLKRSVEPFIRAPFDEFSEARGSRAGTADPLAGAPAQDFLTGAGGFLQTFPAGLAGLRLRRHAVWLDPLLPPQLAAGLTLRGVHWQGRTFDVVLRADNTTVRLTGGPPLGVRSPQGSTVVGRGFPAVLKTRHPDRAAGTGPGGSTGAAAPRPPRGGAAAAARRTAPGGLPAASQAARRAPCEAGALRFPDRRSRARLEAEPR